jgi:hypothetical protein
MSGIPAGALRELYGPMADAAAEEGEEGGGQPVAGAPVAPSVGPGGGVEPPLVAAARSGPARPSARRPLDRDLMRIHGRRIEDLCRWGFTYFDIGRVVGCKASALSRMRSNPAYEPHYLLGLSLTKLWLAEARKRQAARRAAMHAGKE